MYRAALPYTTRTSGIDVFDVDNLFRVREIDAQAAMLNRDEGMFHLALDKWSTKPAVSQPVYYWIEDDILGIATKVNYASGYSATATSIVVDDAKLFVVNSEVFVTRTLENMLVTAVDYTTNTLTVVRGFMGTAAAALVNDDVLVSGPAHLPELGDANEGTGRLPGTEKSNYVSFFSTSFKVSDLQEKAAMVTVDGKKVASITWETANKILEVKRQINKALIFQHRGVYAHTDGTIYVSQGFVHYVQDNVLNLGENNQQLSWPVLSNWIDERLAVHSASSTEKMLLASQWLFSAFLRMQRDMSTSIQQYYDERMGTMLKVTTEGGHVLTVILDRFGFPTEEGLNGWGIVVDMAHCFKREFVNTPLMWRQGVQHAKAHFRQDELFGSFSLELRHPECHGYIRGAGRAIID